jgi:hypothetical protein
VPVAPGAVGGPIISKVWWRHQRFRRLRLHLAVYALILIAIAPFMRLNAPWNVDEGLYVYQVRALQQGDWDLHYWAESIDPDGRWFPLRNHEVSGDSYFPYVKSPTYPMLMWNATRVAGDSVGLHLLPVLGALGAAAAAWLLASQLDRRTAPIAFWVAALGPVVVNAYVVWAHNLSSAVAGLTAYAAIRGLRGGNMATCLVGLSAGAAFGVLLRTEGLLFAAALAVALGLVGATRVLKRMPNVGRPIWLAAAAATTALTVYRLENRWITSIVGHSASEPVRGGDGAPYWQGRLEGAQHILFDSTYQFPGSRFSLMAMGAVVATLIAGLALRGRTPRTQAVGLGATFAAVTAFMVRFAGLTADTAPGIIVAWPIAILGLMLFQWRTTVPVERVLAGIVILEVLATLATQYAYGGGKEWGARYLSPLYPLMAALAAVALFRTTQLSSPTARRRLVGGMVLLGLIPAVGGVWAVRNYRAVSDQPIRKIDGAPGVMVSSEQWAAQRGFRTYPAHEWLHVPVSEIPTVLDRLGPAGHRDVIVFEPLDAWTTDPKHPGGGYQVRRDLGSVVLLVHP